MMCTTRAFAIAAVITFSVCESQSALALGSNEAFGGRYAVNAIAYFRIPIGPAPAVQHAGTSFGIALRGELARPAYQRDPVSDVVSANVDLLNFRFGKNGRVTGVDVGGLYASGDKPPKDTGTVRSEFPGK